VKNIKMSGLMNHKGCLLRKQNKYPTAFWQWAKMLAMEMNTRSFHHSHIPTWNLIGFFKFDELLQQTFFARAFKLFNNKNSNSVSLVSMHENTSNFMNIYEKLPLNPGESRKYINHVETGWDQICHVEFRNYFNPENKYSFNHGA
jgi:hypothetical protein